MRSLELTSDWATFLKESTGDNKAAYAPPVVDEAHAAAATSRLKLQDFAVKPVQRVMRYPMVLTNLLKYMGGERSAQEAKAREKVFQAVLAMKQVAENVDEAKRLREVEIKTEVIAHRMELHSVRLDVLSMTDRADAPLLQSYRSAFISLLGQIQLVGSLHVLYHGPTLDPTEAFKIKYHGIFLYEQHLVIVKVKRASIYEPRHWFPIRYFDVLDISDGSGAHRCRPVRLPTLTRTLQASCPTPSPCATDSTPSSSARPARPRSRSGSRRSGPPSSL